MDFSYTWILILVAIVALGWAGYGIWLYKVRQEEKKEPNKKTKHLENVKKSFEDYAKKMKEYELKKNERKEKNPHEWS